jgi:hypothetical protein
VTENLDYISNVDPAQYNTSINSLIWTVDHVGRYWFNTSKVRFVNYHQSDVNYDSKYWASIFPGSVVEVYTWVKSNELPINYTGVGSVYDVSSYVTSYEEDSAGNLVDIYYYWVRNTNSINEYIGKTLSDSIIEKYISNPQDSGIKYLIPLSPSTYGLVNSGSDIRSNDTILHIGYSSGNNDDFGHIEYAKILAEYIKNQNDYDVIKNKKTII